MSDPSPILGDTQLREDHEDKSVLSNTAFDNDIMHAIPAVVEGPGEYIKLLLGEQRRYPNTYKIWAIVSGPEDSPRIPSLQHVNFMLEDTTDHTTSNVHPLRLLTKENHLNPPFSSLQIGLANSDTISCVRALVLYCVAVKSNSVQVFWRTELHRAFAEAVKVVQHPEYYRAKMLDKYEHEVHGEGDVRMEGPAEESPLESTELDRAESVGNERLYQPTVATTSMEPGKLPPKSEASSKQKKRKEKTTFIAQNKTTTESFKNGQTFINKYMLEEDKKKADSKPWILEEDILIRTYKPTEILQTKSVPTLSPAWESLLRFLGQHNSLVEFIPDIPIELSLNDEYKKAFAYRICIGHDATGVKVYGYLANPRGEMSHRTIQIRLSGSETSTSLEGIEVVEPFKSILEDEGLDQVQQLRVKALLAVYFIWADDKGDFGKETIGVADDIFPKPTGQTLSRLKNFLIKCKADQGYSKKQE